MVDEHVVVGGPDLCPDLLIERLSSEGGALDIADLRPSTFTSDDVRNVMLPLITNLSVRVLHLPIDRTDLICSKAIAMMIKNNVGPPIEELHLSHFPTGEDVEPELCSKLSSIIISSLKHSKNIKKLHITAEFVLHQSIQASIASILYDNNSISSLILRGCGISHAGATKLSCALANNSSIKVLDLSNNQLGSKGICSVALALEMNHTIQKLKLSGTSMGREGGEAMVEALAVNKSLEVLDMSRNALDDVVVTKLARMLKHNTFLRQMSLRSNSFSTIGALCLSLAMYDPNNLRTVLGCNHTIQYLDIQSNKVSRECIMHTNKSLRCNALSSTKNETIRKKVSSFLLESEPNCEYMTDHFGDAATLLKLMPNILWSMNNSTALFYVVKNLTVHSLIADSSPETLSVIKSSSDSIFSTDNTRNDGAKDDNRGAIPEFINVNQNG